MASLGEKRLQLRAVNIKRGNNEVKPATGLDSSLKKNTAMVTKLKSVTADNACKLLKELQKLKYDKYVPELQSSITESALKAKTSADAVGVMELLTELYHRSQQDSELSLKGQDDAVLQIASELVKQFFTSIDLQKTSQSQDDAKADSARQSSVRSSIRCLCEMILCGLLNAEMQMSLIKTFKIVKKQDAKQSDALSSLFNQNGVLLACFLHDVLAIRDISSLHYAYIAVFVAKYYSSDFLGVNDSSNNNEQFISGEVQSYCKSLTMQYYDRLCFKIQSLHRQLAKVKQAAHNNTILRGDASLSQKDRLEVLQADYDKLVGFAQCLANALSLELPSFDDTIDDQVEDTKITIAAASGSSKGDEFDVTKSQWLDEEQKEFYTELAPMSNLLPPSCLQVAELDSAESSKKDKRRLKRKQKAQQHQQKQTLGDLDYDAYDDENGDWMDQADEDVLEYVEQIIFNDKENETENSVQAARLQAIGQRSADPIDNLMSQLPLLVNKGDVDNLAVEFSIAQQKCRGVAKEKLISKLLDVARFRLDSLPYYARLIATLDPYVQSLGATVLVALISEFKRRYRKQYPVNMEHRVKNIRFIGELIKFRVAPPHLFFYCTHRLVKPESSGSVFHDQHVEVFCHLLECCGRFVYVDQEIGPRFKPLLDVFEKKVKQTALDQRVVQLVQSALLTVNPPAVTDAEIQEPLKTLVEWYILRTLCVDLKSKKDVQSISDRINQLPWCTVESPLYSAQWQTLYKSQSLEGESQQIYGDIELVNVNIPQVVLSIFSQPWLLKKHQLSLFAQLLSHIKSNNGKQQLIIQVVDNVLEEIRIGLEDFSEFRYNQRRLSTISYFAELFIQKLVSKIVLSDTLDLLLQYGHKSADLSLYYQSIEQDQGENALIDGPKYYFRIRIICALMSASAAILRTKAFQSAMSRFLVKFDYYIWLKDQETFPLELKFAVEDCFEQIKPGFHRSQSVEESMLKYQEMMINLSQPSQSQQSPSVKGKSIQDSETADVNNDDGTNAEDSQNALVEQDQSEDDHFDSNQDADIKQDDQSIQEQSSDVDSDDDLDNGEDDDEEEESLVSKMIKSQQSSVESKEEQEQFSAAFNDILVESIQSRKNERVMSQELLVPLMTSRSNSLTQLNAENAPTKVKFTLMTKKSNKQVLKALEIPSEAKIVQQTKNQQAAAMEEKKKLKDLVLRQEQRMNQQQYQSSSAYGSGGSLRSPGSYEELDGLETLSIGGNKSSSHQHKSKQKTAQRTSPPVATREGVSKSIDNLIGSLSAKR
ncbi:hypothetical protein MIR68_012094 [Amoeboaphelidium protococcarum]|nr:hypothetical protein MIR68_012094 [Amoeboaphelidium protococcarum]